MSCKNRDSLAKFRARRLCNDPNDIVDENLRGMAMIHRGLVILEGYKAVLRRDYDDMPDKVKLMSGGGAGNEPTHAGFVGPGMLTAAISGNVYSAPSSDSILKVIQELATDHLPGLLLIVQNYTGYRINFALAKLRAQNKGLIVKMIIVGDDACLRTFEKTAGERGLSGTLFVHKVAGAMAEEGKKLEEIYAVCKRITCGGNIATIGICSKVPFLNGVCACTQTTSSEQVEIGCGIHGESGVSRVCITTAKDIVSKLIDVMMDKDVENSLELNKYHVVDNEVAVIIDNLGGCSQLETGVFAMEVIQQLTKLGLKVERIYIGLLMTSLDTNGLQFSVMNLSVDPNLKKYLDAQTAAPAWPKVFCLNDLGPNWENTEATIMTSGKYIEASNAEDTVPKIEPCGPIMNERTAQVFLIILTFACEALIACADQLDIMDEDSGDGDCGTTLAQGAKAIRTAIKENQIMGSRPFVALTQISRIIEREMTGLQGGLYSLFFDAAAKVFAKSSPKDPIVARVWLCALTAANKTVAEYGRAKEGDRTMLDPLFAAENVLAESLEANCHPIRAFGEAVKAAEERIVQTVHMPATVGRASLVKCKVFKYPDPGAHAVGIWMRAVYEGIKLKLSC